ncbi:MAG: hypothetical protein ISS79_07380 [Phycisphaerae bacterium]|nr:hypothetical protein [Phycisphaerae bacterium]
MDKDFLQDYWEREIEHCERIYKGENFRGTSTREKLRLLYGVSGDTDVVYCETGGIENLDNFAPGSQIVLTVFPYKTQELFERHLGKLDTFLAQCQEGRVVPVLQSPFYYQGLKHLEPFFTRVKASSYFVRGQYAYAALRDEEDPELVRNQYDGIDLASVARLRKTCQSKHAGWLKKVVGDSECWEHRYRCIGPPDIVRVRSSLEYRYASVGYCIGEDLVDEIIMTFDHRVSSAILLQLHILFDHVIAHGFGSHFSAHLNADGGIDFRKSRTGVLRSIEHTICQDLTMAIPEKQDEYFRELLKYDHPLKGIDLNTLDAADLDEVSARIRAQFQQFNRNVERLGKGRHLAQRLFSIGLLLLGAAILSGGNITVGLGVAASSLETKPFKIPKDLANAVVEAIRRLYRHNIASFLLSGK